jgi:hypothetical protein
MPPVEGLRIVASPIHGYGGVATRRFARGETLCFADGVLYTEADDFDDTYSLVLAPEDSGLPYTVFWDLTCQTRWLNHSCDPNTEVMAEWDPEARAVRAWWVALRDIEPGEEITYDYAFTAEVAEPCACRAPRCRGLIVDDDAENLARLPPELRAHLHGPRPA